MQTQSAVEQQQGSSQRAPKNLAQGCCCGHACVGHAKLPSIKEQGQMVPHAYIASNYACVAAQPVHCKQTSIRQTIVADLERPHILLLPAKSGESGTVALF